MRSNPMGVSAGRRFGHKNVSNLSGNEIFCLNRMGFEPGQICFGNSVHSLGIGIKGFGAAVSSLFGGEVREITELVSNGRRQSFDRMRQQAMRDRGEGITGVTFDVITHGACVEFLTIGSSVQKSGADDRLHFSSSSNVQQLYCQVDAGFQPKQFVFGNVAYSLGVGGGVFGALRSLSRGEVKEYTEVFEKTRKLAVERIKLDAQKAGANSILGIETSIQNMFGVREMIMTGTASVHPLLVGRTENPVTSALSNVELWNLIHLGFMPVDLVMAVSVCSLGIKGELNSLFRTLGGGEIHELSEVLDEARERTLNRMAAEADRLGADQVVGVKTQILELPGGMIEFMVIGTAVKKMAGVGTVNQSLPPQATVFEKDTFIFEGGVPVSSGVDQRRPGTESSSVKHLIILILIFTFIFLRVISHSR